MRSREEVIRDFVQQWLDKAESDHAAAKVLVHAETQDYFPATFHCQQAVEKFIKAFLVRHQIEFRKTHDLNRLVGLVGKVAPDLEEELAASIWLTPFGVEFRYPGDYPEVGQVLAQNALIEAMRARQAILEHLASYLEGEDHEDDG